MRTINPLLTPTTIAISISAAIGISSFSPAVADDYIVQHPWIHSSPNDGVVHGSGDPVLGEDGRPLIILHRPHDDNSGDSIGNASADDRIVLQTNILSFTSSPAIAITSQNQDGIIIDDKTVWNWDGPGVLNNPDKSAIHIGGTGSLSGEVLNSGNIKGGIYITSEVDSSTSVYETSGGATGFDQATLEDGINIVNGGVAEAANDHAIKISSHAYVDYIRIGEGSRLTAEGSSRSAVYIGEDGQLGGDFDYNHGIDTLRTLRGDEIGTPDPGSTQVVNGIDVLPDDPATNYPRAGDSDDLAVGVSPNSFVNTNFPGVDNINDVNNPFNGADDSDGDGNPDLYKEVVFDLGTVSGDANRSETDTSILVEGWLESQQYSAVNVGVGGVLTGKVHIKNTGTLSGAGGGGEDKGALWNQGTHRGSILNEGEITGGIFISGSQATNSIDGEAAYHSMGTNSDPSTLRGSYTVLDGGTVTAGDNHAVFLDRNSRLDFIKIHGSGSELKAEGTENSAIYIEEDAILGGSESGRSNIDSAVTVDNSGKLTSSAGSAIEVEGQLFGKLHVNGGTVSGGGDFGAVYVDDTGEFISDDGIALLIENGGVVTNTDIDGAAIEVDGMLTGAIRIGNGGSLIASAATDEAIDFNLADSPLHFIQDGSGAVTTGAIQGSIFTDRVELLSGSYTGSTIEDIEELVVSTDATVNITGNLTLAENTTIQVEEGHSYSGAIINVAGTLSADPGTALNIKPASLAAYRELAAEPRTLVVATVTSTINDSVVDNTSTGLEGVALDYVSTAGALIQAGPVAVDGNDVTVTVSKVNDKAFYQQLLEETISETSTTLIAQGSAVLSSPQLADTARAEVLFDSLNSTTDFNTLATQVAQPLNITTRAGLGAMNTAQNITLSEGRNPLVGFSYGDGFNFGEFWGQAIYSKSDQNTVSKSAGYDGKTHGYIVGAGLDISDHWRTGIAGAWTRTRLDGNQGADLTVTSYISSLYSNWQQGQWFFDSLLTLGISKNDTLRYISTQKVESDYNSTLWGLRAVAGRNFNYGQWTLSPQAEFNYGRVAAEEYTEKGNSGWEAKIKASDYEVMELGGGLRLDHNYSLRANRGSIRPELSIMGYYDIKERGSEFEATYLAGGDPFVVAEAQRDRFRMQSALGVTMDIMDSLTLNAAYNLNWSDHYKAHSFSAKAKYQF